MAAVAVVLSLTACQQEDDFAPQAVDDEIRINFTSDAIQTRVNTLGTGDKWENDDQILVVNATNNEQAVFTASAANGSVSWTQDTKLYWDGDGNNTLLASYPAGSGYGSFTLPADQSDESKLKSADYMNACCIGTKSQGAVTFAMKHRMAMITATYTVENEFVSGTDLSKAEVYSTSSAATFDHNQNGEMSLDQQKKWVNAYIRDGKFTAIVMPGSYKAGQELMRVTVEGKSEPLIVKVKEDFSLAEGGRCSFTLSVGKEYIYAKNMTADELKAAIIERLKAGETSFYIDLPATVNNDVFPAIQDAFENNAKGGTIDLTLTGIEMIPEMAFYIATPGVALTSYYLKSISLPDALEIGEYAFSTCKELQSVYIPKVTLIENFAFDNCYALIEISAPEVTEIGKFAFVACSGLEKIYCPKATKIGYYAFQSNLSLTEVTFGALVSVEHSVFGIFYGTNTGNIDLVLSSEQKVMQKGTDNYWTATETDYNGSEDHNNKSFIGFQFKSVTLQ